MADLKVVLVDDHEVVRAGLRALLDSQDDLTVVGEAGTAEEGVRRVGFDEPDVVVLDVRLPDASGIEACREIRSRFPEVRVLMLTSFADEEALMAAILAGASGYVLKRIKSDDLVSDIRRVGAGESLLDSEMTDRLFERLRNGPKEDPLLSALTGQERTIVQHIAEGLTNRQIADRLFMSIHTVEAHLSAVYRTLGIGSRRDLPRALGNAEAPIRDTAGSVGDSPSGSTAES